MAACINMATCSIFVAVFLGYDQYWPGGFMVLWRFYVQEHPKAQPAVVLVFKASQKTRPRLKVSSDRLGEAGNRVYKT